MYFYVYKPSWDELNEFDFTKRICEGHTAFHRHIYRKAVNGFHLLYQLILRVGLHKGKNTENTFQLKSKQVTSPNLDTHCY